MFVCFVCFFSVKVELVTFGNLVSRCRKRHWTLIEGSAFHFGHCREVLGISVGVGSVVQVQHSEVPTEGEGQAEI